MPAADVIAAWDQADPADIHPLRQVSELAYLNSGASQAEQIATVIPVGSSVVDFGCGDGRVAVPLQGLGFNVTGVDSSPAMLKRLSARAPAMTTVQSDGLNLAARLDEPVDAVIALAILIHHSRADGARIITGLATAVRPGGHLILDWPVSEHPRDGRHWIDITTWGADEQAALVRKLGLTPVDTDLPWSVWRT
ncbi:class I SAM-dependent methyltransferase [Streptomyces sp. NPDC049967]|uniref:class I SAM-dependent methyltransferase n=1 Tax=Streptomyces sp. NPDC049967 TaxID=3155658 RepID=UPI00343F3158